MTTRAAQTIDSSRPRRPVTKGCGVPRDEDDHRAPASWRRPPGGSLVATEPDGSLERRRDQIAWRSFRPGESLPGCGYQVVRPRSAGGMGEIYEVRDRQGRLAAMKVLSSDLQGRNALVGRMLDEACALRLIHHPNLVRWLDAGVLTNGRPFLVTELLRGRTLRAHLGLFGAVSPPRAQRWTTHLLLALDAIHGVDLVHCDVKLDNVFLCVDGTIKLLDLGAAERANSRHEGASLPPIGTPRYMAPEQLAGGDVDARTDVFAAGLLLAELLCGGWPFGDRPGSDPGTQVAAGHPRIARQARDLSAVVARAAAPEPDARYPSALAMARRVLSPPRRSVRAAPDCRSAAERLLVSDQ